MSDIAMDPDGDLLIGNDGDIQLIDGNDELVQRLDIKLSVFLAEWFREPEFGTPYLEDVLVKDPQASVVDAVFRSQILSTEGVKTLDQFDIDYDEKARSLKLTFAVTGPEGQTEPQEVTIP